MLAPTVYVETSVVGHLVGRKARDVIVAANRLRDWERDHPKRLGGKTIAPRRKRSRQRG